MLCVSCQAHVAFVLNHIIPRHTRWAYKEASQRWRITSAAISILHAALTVKPHFHSGVSLGELSVLLDCLHQHQLGATK